MKQHTVERKIVWGDLDALGIVFYPRYYEWIDAGAHLFFEAIDLNPNHLWKARNILFGLVESGCRYFKPGRYHQLIRIVTGIDALTTKTIILKHRIVTVADDQLMVEGTEKRICLDVSDPEAFRAQDIPADIFERLKNARGE